MGQSKTWINHFENLQNRAKSIVGKTASAWPSILTERKRKVALSVFKSFNGIGKINSINYDVISHSISTRGNKNLIRLPRVRTEAAKKSTQYQGALIYNSLPTDIRNEIYFSNFKRAIKSYEF